MTRVVPVDLGDRSYEVVVGDGVRHELARVVAETVPGARRAVVVTQEGIGVGGRPRPPPSRCSPCPTASRPSRWPRSRTLCRRFARSGLSRADVVVAVGGGVVTDLAGFAAASFHRGTRLRERRHVAAGPGGRGHRWQDRGQHPGGEEPGRCLLAAERRAVRHRDPRHPAAPRVGVGPRRGGQVRAARHRHRASVRPPTADLPIDEQVARCAAIKAAVVAADEREGDRRMLLNYGHTLAHALEAATFGDEGRRPAPRRGGGRRSGVRRAAGPAAGSDRRCPGRPPPPGGRRLRPRHRPAGRAPSPTSCCRSWAGTRRPRATSPSCSTAPAGSRWSVASTGPTSSLPWRTWSRTRSRR